MVDSYTQRRDVPLSADPPREHPYRTSPPLPHPTTLRRSWLAAESALARSRMVAPDDSDSAARPVLSELTRVRDGWAPASPYARADFDLVTGEEDRPGRRLHRLTNAGEICGQRRATPFGGRGTDRHPSTVQTMVHMNVHWYLRSLADQDTHRGELCPDGRVTAVCGVEFVPPVYSRLALAAGPPDPEQICPTCASGDGSRGSQTPPPSVHG